MRTREIPARTSLFLVAVALTSALALAVAPSAQAANIAPNPGFEMDCSGVPCQWNNPSAGTTPTRDTSVFHNGVASLKVSGTANGIHEDFSDCIETSVSAGSHHVEYFYNNSGPNVLAGSLSLLFDFYSSLGCSGFIKTVLVLGSSTGGWSLSSDTMTVPANVQSLILRWDLTCTASGPCSANFDDVDLDTTILAVTVSSFTAHRSHRGVLLRWSTGTEVNELGFNIYRQQGNRRFRVNRRLLPAFGAVAGASYSFLDRHALRHRAVRYWLQDVSVSGARAWHGPVRVPAS